MRLLHTGDWHVGKTIRGRSRLDEFEDALDQVVGIAVEEGVDVVLVAGDLYEHRAAPPESDLLVFDTFLRLQQAGIPVVAIPGNHDSAPRLEALSGLLSAVGVSVIPWVARPDEGSLVEVPSGDGSEAALVACVPFVPERRFGDAASLFEATEAWYQSYADGLGGLVGAMSSAFRPDRVNVLMAHLFTAGALIAGSEREIKIGLEYAMAPSRLPGQASYVALGHVHRPQRIRGAPSPSYYAGSLLQLDFGEHGQSKSVVLVEAAAGRPAKVREIPLTAGRRLVDVHATLADLPASAQGLEDAHLRVFVKTSGPVPGVAQQVRDLLPNAVDVTLEYEREEQEVEGPPMASLQPREQFLRYYADRYGADPELGLLEAFDEVLALAHEEA